MEHNPDTCEWRKAESAGEAKGMEERKDAEDTVAVVEMKDLLDLFYIGGEIEVGENDALGFAGGPAGENDCGGVIEGHRARDSQETLE
jgi:hypothetical protein